MGTTNLDSLALGGNLTVTGTSSFTGSQTLSSPTLAAGGTKTLTSANNGQIVLLDTAAGSVVTLPAATGSGIKFKFLVTTLATSNSHKIQVANASDTMIGSIVVMSDDAAAVLAFFAGSTSDTITLNRTTTGSVTLGEYIEVTDVASTKWAVSGVISATGTEATPFSAAVS